MTRQAAHAPLPTSGPQSANPHTAEFKRGMRALPGGVTVLAARGQDGEPLAMTASSVTSLSIDPPSLLVCVGRTASIARALARLRHFSVNVLAADQIDVARAFGGQLDVTGIARFAYGHWRDVDGTAVPVLAGARVSFDCEVSHVHDWATHHIVIGSVRHVHVDAATKPSLVYVDGSYRAIG
ncbi:MAG: flavin reductase family protein [Rhodoferax sp.]|jgi:flavin reductase (DIM6/NTAB) family NADH-FMN oxidoreductase RutF|nr:flavin reductase family protein [Rhodoferax sp.]